MTLSTSLLSAINTIRAAFGKLPLTKETSASIKFEIGVSDAEIGVGVAVVEADGGLSAPVFYSGSTSVGRDVMACTATDLGGVLQSTTVALFTTGWAPGAKMPVEIAANGVVIEEDVENEIAIPGYPDLQGVFVFWIDLTDTILKAMTTGDSVDVLISVTIHP